MRDSSVHVCLARQPKTDVWVHDYYYPLHGQLNVSQVLTHGPINGLAESHILFAVELVTQRRDDCRGDHSN